MSKNDYGFQKIIDFFNTATSAVGQSVTNDKWYKFPRCLYQYLCILIFLCSWSSGYPYLKQHMKDLAKVTEFNVHFSLNVHTTIKLFMYMGSRYKFVEIIKKIKEFRQNHIVTEKEREICEEWTKKSTPIPKLIYGCYLGTIIPAALKGYFTNSLPYAMQLPYISHTDFPGYQINFVHQIVAILIGSSMTCMIDSMFIVLIQEGCMRLDVTKEKMSHLGKECGNNNISEQEVLRELHDRHLETNEYLYSVNSTYSSMMFLQFASSVFIITNLMVNVATSPVIDLGICSLIVSFLMQIFLMCWFGEQVRTRVDDIVHSMYDNHWYDLQVSTRKSLSIMMSCSQKEYCISAGGLINLTLATFVAIMKSAYSYYAVMKDSSG